LSIYVFLKDATDYDGSFTLTFATLLRVIARRIAFFLHGIIGSIWGEMTAAGQQMHEMPSRSLPNRVSRIGGEKDG
jgi:hypothetical protein